LVQANKTAYGLNREWLSMARLWQAMRKGFVGEESLHGVSCRLVDQQAA